MYAVVMEALSLIANVQSSKVSSKFVVCKTSQSAILCYDATSAAVFVYPHFVVYLLVRALLILPSSVCS